MKLANEHMTLRRAAVELFGWPNTRASAVRLRRTIARREKALGVEIAVRNGPSPSPWYVTLSLLRDHMPELFSRRDEVLRLVRSEASKTFERVWRRVRCATMRWPQESETWRSNARGREVESSGTKPKEARSSPSGDCRSGEDCVPGQAGGL